MTIVDCVSAATGGVRLAIQVKPSARKDEVVGIVERRLLLNVAAVPVDGAANKATIKALSRLLNWPASQIKVANGQSSRKKLIMIIGANLEDIKTKLESAIEEKNSGL